MCFLTLDFCFTVLLKNRLILGYTKVILIVMKTAISVPDEIFELSEKLARKLKVSRSKIFAMGVKKLGEQYDDEELIANINKVCEKVNTSVDPALFKMTMLSLSKEEW